MKTYTKIHRLLLGAFAVALFATMGVSPALAGAAKPEGEKTASSACPSSPAGFKEAKNVGFDIKNSGLVSTYYFFSKAEAPISTGVPGLIKYCVYTDSKTAPKPITVQATGANGALWTISTKKQNPGNFGFVRPGGNETNIPLDGKEVVMGTATWGTLPKQEILLHINDPTVCAALYPAGEYELPPETCFVRPINGPPPQNACEEGAGNTEAAYNSIPTGFPECEPPPSFAFEGNFASEFGDMVELGKGGEVTEMRVDFQSYGCSLSGHWNTGDCKTEPPGEPTFTIPGGITASIYRENGSGRPQYAAAATATIGESELAIPYRPSASGSCTGGDLGKFVGPAGGCVNSLPVLLNFTFAPGTSFSATDKVFWTVQFKTSNAGYPPIGNNTSCREAGNPGCGYDSLNVGTRTYPNSAYAGKDVADTTWVDFGIVAPGNLETQSLSCPECVPLLGPADLRPLGEIVTK